MLLLQPFLKLKPQLPLFSLKVEIFLLLTNPVNEGLAQWFRTETGVARHPWLRKTGHAACPTWHTSG